MPPRCCKHSFILFIVLVLLGAWSVSCRQLVLHDGGTETLVQALNDTTVDTIVLGSNYSVVSEFSGPLPALVQLKRNVTITGSPGKVPPVTLDLAFKRAAVLVCPECDVTLRDLVLRKARRGSGAALDFFVGDDGSGAASVMLQNVLRHRLACTPGSDAAEVLANTPRSKMLPPSSSGQQEFSIKTVTSEGISYPDAIFLKDFTQDLPLVHQEGRGHAATAHFGGYALGSYNVTYLCENLVTQECLAEKPPEACVNELIDNLLGKSTQQQGKAGPPLAAIIVPSIVGGAFLAAATLLLLRRRRQQGQQQLGKDMFDPEAKLQPYPSPIMYSFTRTNTDLRPPGSGLDSASDVHSTHAKSQNGRRSLEVAMQPVGRQQGWQLVSCATAAFVQAPSEANGEVEFGALLGAGSYGRVYRARWAGQDVACKVIQHDRSTLQAVEAEADLMLLLHHPNVVKAFHYCTFTYTELHSEKSRGSRAWSQLTQGNARPSFCDSQSSGGSRRPPGSANDSAQLLSISTSQQQASGSTHSGSGSSARVLLLQQQQQQGAVLLQDEPSDVLVTNLSLDAQGAAEAAQVAASLSGVASATATLGSSAKTQGVQVSSKGGTSQQSGDEGGLSAGDSVAVKHKAETWLVQEYCDMGTLSSIASTWEPEDECDEQMLERLQLLRDAAQGLEALHTNHVVHGDVNARNVLVSSSTSSSLGMCAKVADLGLARCLAHHATHRTTNSCGTMSHMAPELLRYGRLSPAVDVYAFGIMMWELHNHGQAAFGKLHYGQFFETVVLRQVRPCVPAGMAPDYELLMRHCWAGDPADRPSTAVLRQCLELMVADKERKVQEAAAALAAAGAAGTSDVSSRPGSSGIDAAAAAAGDSAPAGTDVLPAIKALLPQSQRVLPSVPPRVNVRAAAAADAAGSAVAVSPSADLSDVSLSALFPDVGTPPSETVLIIGEQQAAAQPAPAAAAAAGSRAAAASARRPSRPVVRAAGAAGVCTPPRAVSPVGGGSDVENQLDRDSSVHANRLWFV